MSQECKPRWASVEERPSSAENIARNNGPCSFMTLKTDSLKSFCAKKESDVNTVIFMVTEEQVKTRSFPGFDKVDCFSTVSLAPLNMADFTGKAKSKAVLYSSSNTRVIFVGLGPEKDVTLDVIRVATNCAIVAANEFKLQTVGIVVPNVCSSAYLCGISASRSHSSEEATDLLVVDAMARVCFLGNHKFDKYLNSDNAKPRVSTVHLLMNGQESGDFLALAQKAAEKGATVATGTIFARELGNDRADKINPATVEAIARDFGKGHNVTVNAVQMKELLDNGYNLICAVGQGAEVTPRLVTLHYKGDPSSDKVDIALVGKGITFDTGGLNLKGTGNIEDMHLDMGGSAAVIGALKVLSSCKAKVNVVGVLALAENAISAKAVYPHQIIQTKKGTVEIGNTDAEGRLVLADALQYVQINFQPQQVINLATLTGACVVALGEYLAGCFTNDNTMAQKLMKCGDNTFERCWHLPILPEHSAELAGNYSDLRNIGKGRYGGASTAAAFLKKYIEKDVTWTHLDIAGPGMYSADRDYMCKGGTGFGVQLLVEYVEQHIIANKQ